MPFCMESLGSGLKASCVMAERNGTRPWERAVANVSRAKENPVRCIYSCFILVTQLRTYVRHTRIRTYMQHNAFPHSHSCAAPSCACHSTSPHAVFRARPAELHNYRCLIHGDCHDSQPSSEPLAQSVKIATPAVQKSFFLFLSALEAFKPSLESVPPPPSLF